MGMGEIRGYVQLTTEEQNTLSDAWVRIEESLATYERITGARHLTYILHDYLWKMVQDQQEAEATTINETE